MFRSGGQSDVKPAMLSSHGSLVLICRTTERMIQHCPAQDPCEGVECPATQVCQLDNNRNPICRCNAICSPDFRPVCGSDGKTYINECSLRVESCKSRRSLRIIFSGECSSGEILPLI
ncbi:hypothetical protein TNCV_3394031 [Trichonephila clavipes]|nr:hypothetical protein TNCV_3394031 [Trichonephila clavipes]